jgi:uncharacterized protein involved in outer membrane biogenesis
VPWFVNWSDYRPSFESQASRILGQPVHVLGTAHARILPSPSVTFTEVAVGDPANPLMTVKRFAVTVELLPLFGGQIHVVAMRLDEPSVHVTVDADGISQWLRRAATADAIAPDSVALTDVRIENGSLDYRDAKTGVALVFSNVSAALADTSLAGPWQIDGEYADGGATVPFHVATGRKLDDGTIRTKISTRPAAWPVAAAVDGVLSITPAAGLTYIGTYDIDEVSATEPDAPPAGAAPAPPLGWQSQGSFTLTRDKVVVDKAVLSHSASGGAVSVAGSLTTTFGSHAAFDAAITAKQLDLDRLLGRGQPQADVGGAVRQLVDLAATATDPPIPGRIAVSVPAVVIGGAVAQDVAFTAATTPGGWTVSGFNAALPGQASLTADGQLATGRQLGFSGRVRLAAAQPAVLAGWWRGTAPPAAGVPLPAVEIAGDARIGVDRLAISNGTARLGDAAMSGTFSWSRDRQDRRELDTDLKADRINVDDLTALAELIAGGQIGDARTLADSFMVRFSAAALTYQGIAASNVAIDAGYASDSLKVVQIAVGDLGGASLKITGGRIDGLTTAAASGSVEAHIAAENFDGLARIAARIAPDSGLPAWLAAHATVLSPAAATIRIAAPAEGGAGAYGVSASGVAGQTTFAASLNSDARPADVWTGTDRFSVTLDSPDSAALVRQLGLDAASPAEDPGAHVAIEAKGVPSKGLSTTVEASVAKLAASASGTTTFDAALHPSFEGALKVSSDDVRPALEAARVTLPGLDADPRVAIAGTVAIGPSDLALSWKDGHVAGRAVGGTVMLSSASDAWRLSGNLDLDLVDLRWLTDAALGTPLAFSGDAAAPWSKTPFSAPDRREFSADLALAASRLSVSPPLDIQAARAQLTIDPDRVDLRLTEGTLAGGAISGRLSLRNVDGNANVAAQLNLGGAAVAPNVWNVGGAPLATGAFDLDTNLEANGRSMAALVSSATGGGAVTLHNAVVRGVNVDAVTPIVRVADLGEEYSEDALRAAVESQIGLGSLSVGAANGGFALAGGTVRFNDLSIDRPGLLLSGDTTIDLNRLAIDSSWTYAFRATAGADAPPAVGVTFRGPLIAPQRTIDVVPLSSYLSTRQAGRMVQILAVEDADRLEQERFAREILRFRDEPARAARQRRADAAAAQAQALAARAALERAAELTATARDAAVARAAEAVAVAADARARAGAAAADLAKAKNVENDTSAAEVRASADIADARSASATAATTATNLAATVEAADRAAAVAASALASAQAAADKVEAAVRDANDRLDLARRKAADSRSAADAAATTANGANTVLQSAGSAASDALKRNDAAQAALAATSTDLAAASAESDRATTAAASAVQIATTSDADRARLTMLAKAAADALAAAKAERDAAREAFQAANTASTYAQGEMDRVEQEGAPAVVAAAKKADADNRQQALRIAQDRYDTAEARTADLAAKADATEAAAEKAANAATLRGADATTATARKATTQTALDMKAKAKVATAAEVNAAQAAATAAGAAFDSAQTKAHAAADELAAADQVAKAADSELSAATRASAAVTAGSAGFALQQAIAAQKTAVADAAAARARSAAAEVAAKDASAHLGATVAAHEAAATALAAAKAASATAAKAAADADAAAVQAEAAAASAAELVRQRAAEAAAAAAALQAAAPVPAKAAVAPLPRQKPKTVPGAVAGDQPLQLVPLAR